MSIRCTQQPDGGPAVQSHVQDTAAAPVQASNTISVWNNGDGVPVEVHKEEGVYVPELIFGHLLTSSNYNDTEKKVAPPGCVGTRALPPPVVSACALHACIADGLPCHPHMHVASACSMHQGFWSEDLWGSLVAA